MSFYNDETITSTPPPPAWFLKYWICALSFCFFSNVLMTDLISALTKNNDIWSFCLEAMKHLHLHRSPISALTKNNDISSCRFTEMKQLHLHLRPRRDFWNIGSVRSVFVFFQMLLMTNLISALTKNDDIWSFCLEAMKQLHLHRSPISALTKNDDISSCRFKAMKQLHLHLRPRRDFWNIGSVPSRSASLPYVVHDRFYFCVKQKTKMFHHFF